MGKVVATLVVVTVLGVAVVFFVAGGRPMNEPQAHELTDEEKQEYHRYLMSSDCSGLVSLGACKPRLPKELWLPAWHRGAHAAVKEAEMGAAYDRYVQSIGLLRRHGPVTRGSLRANVARAVGAHGSIENTYRARTPSGSRGGGGVGAS